MTNFTNEVLNNIKIRFQENNPLKRLWNHLRFRSPGYKENKYLLVEKVNSSTEITLKEEL
tara:strand:- start:75 stop:254 length:180 start_codon:yes stop_codon:yes gene_type:complete